MRLMVVGLCALAAACSSIPPKNDGGMLPDGGAGGGSGLTRFGTFDLDTRTQGVGYIAMALDPVAERVGIAYLVQVDAFNNGPDSGQAADGGNTANWEVRYVEWKQGVASAPQVLREQVLDDLAGLRAQGVTEVFFDLNFSPDVGSPDVNAGEALAYAEHVLEAFAPAHLSR